MNKNIEVEFRARIDNLSEFKEKLSNNGFKLDKEIQLKDAYFCRKDIFSLKDTEQTEVGSYALRLRQKNDGEKLIATINTKIITARNDHNQWREYESVVADYDQMKKILEGTEFKVFFTLEKTRCIYRVEDMSVCLEDIVDFGGAIEVEIMTDEKNAEDAKAKIRKFLNDYGVADEMIVPKSITNIIMHQRAKF